MDQNNESKIIAEAIEQMCAKDKKNMADIIGKIIAGIIDISETHGKFSTAMIPMLKVISEEKNIGSKEATLKSFSLFTKKFIRSNIVTMNTDPETKEILKDIFIVPIVSSMPLLDNADECIALSLRDLSNAYEKFDDDIRSMVISGKINTWKERFKTIEADILSIYDEIKSLEEDLGIAFLREDKRDFFASDNLDANKNKVSIRRIGDIETYIKDTFKCLDDTYLNCIKLQFLILSTIDISDPLNMNNKSGDLFKSVMEVINNNFEDKTYSPDEDDDF